MKRFSGVRLVLVSLCIAVLATPSVLRGAEAAPDPAGLASVLGPNASSWKIGGTPVFTSDSGRPAMGGATGQTLTLENPTPQAAPAELNASFRLRPQSGYADVQVQMGCRTLPDKSPQALDMSVGWTAGNPDVAYSVSMQGPKPAPAVANGYLYLTAVTDRSLSWSEEMRAAVDAVIAGTPKPEDTLYTLRGTVDGHHFRGWVNGRYAGEVNLPAGTDTSGGIRVIVTPGAQLVSLRVAPLNPAPYRFEPLSIGGNLNAQRLAGASLDRASLPSGAIDGVPFYFPQPAASGNDHIDVGQSWTRFGAISGYIAANAYAFGGRWVSADHVDPDRICMYIPPGRYKALHLIAVADPEQEPTDSVQVVTAQFYRPDAGHPLNFPATVPNLKGHGGDVGQGERVNVKLANGKSARLYHVTIPLDPDAFSWFTDLPRIGLEITKQVQFYRAYPDPLEYSWHGAGLPSSVQVYAMTLERAGVDIDIKPDTFGHVWTAPATPGYTIELRNHTGAATTASVGIVTRSNDGLDTSRQEQRVELPAGDAPVDVPLSLHPVRYGLHKMVVTLRVGHDTSTYQRNFAYLHPDTRDHTPWQSGEGSIFGGWFWGGGHDTPTSLQDLPVMAAAGAETAVTNYAQSPKDVQAVAEKYHFMSEEAFAGNCMYISGFTGIAGGSQFDPAHPEEDAKEVIKRLKEIKLNPSAISRPTYLPFFAEPQIGPITMGTWPAHWGDDYTLSKDEQATFDNMKAKFLVAARAVRKEWPDVKLLLPYGDPMNAAVFLRLCPESRDLIDGCALDLPGFERLPEQQIHQVVFNRLYSIMSDIHKYKSDPYLVLIEGFCVSSKDIDTGDKGEADICTRDFLNLMGYGVTRFESANASYDCADYWGENHYGGALCSRLPVCEPKIAYTQYATITRHLNRANFSKYVPTGSTSTYCEQFKHYKTGKLIHVLWTIRGTRPVSVRLEPGASVEVYDSQDNTLPVKVKDGMATFTIAQAPAYLEGLTSDAQITLGESDNSDAAPAEEHKKLSNLGDGKWKLVSQEDAEYAHNKPLQVERFLGNMTATPVKAPHKQGGEALAIHLEKQEKDRGVMPFYTTLVPNNPITIRGKASHLGMWVHAASDWGRVVYVLRDAKGEKWISVGSKEEWNNDDIHGWSSFCFDGWRYLDFELPSSAPYDSYREYGTTWWGSYGGDGIVDLPLTLEKVIVERRPKVVYGNDLVEAKPDDVLLGDLYAEYASDADRGEEAVRLSKIRMPMPTHAPALPNPIAEMAKTGVGPATKALKVRDPLQEYDGTRGNVDFEPVPGAKSYDIWVSAYPDGRGAMKLGDAWKESGGLINGLRADTEFYLFVVYTDAKGKPSKPSVPLKFSLKDRFGYK